MVLKHKGKDISSLEDIQKLKVKDLRKILRFHAELTDLVLQVFALLMRCVLPSAMKPIHHKSKTMMVFNMNRP